MAKSLILRFTEVIAQDGKKAWDSNLVVVNGTAGIHIETGKPGSSITVFRSMTGLNMVTSHHDYFGDVCDFFLPYPGIGYTIKLRLNYEPIMGFILGSDENALDDAGDANKEDKEDLTNALAGKEGVYFLGKDGQYFLGKTIV